MKLFAFMVLVCVARSRSWGAAEKEEEAMASASCPTGCKCNDATLSCRGLSEIPSLAGTPTRFTDFLFYDCNIETLSVLPAEYSGATTLLVINSGLSTIAEDAFQLLDQLETLELSGNRLRSFSKSLLRPLRNLLKLDLSFNRVQTLEDELFRENLELRELCLDGNHLEFSENLFLGAEKLAKFTCNYCYLKEIPVSSLKRIKSLKVLELNENAFQDLSRDSFSGFELVGHQVLEMSLDNCSLATIDKKAFGPFKSLQQLNLGHNLLKNIHMGTFKYFWHSLGKLYIESNKLTFVDENLAPWSILEEMKLSNNPWNCDCDMAWVKDISADKFHKENVTCYSPTELRGHSIQKVAASLNCPNHKYFLILGFGIPALVISLLVTVCCVIKLSSGSYARKRNSVKYSQVYGETVVTSTFNSRKSLI